MPFTVGELVAVLDRYDQLVIDCALGRIPFRDWERSYGACYVEYALDGHAFALEEQQVLHQFAERIALHREITERVIYHLTSDDLLSHPEAIKAGFIGTEEGLNRVRHLARQYLGVTAGD